MATWFKMAGEQPALVLSDVGARLGIRSGTKGHRAVAMALREGGTTEAELCNAAAYRVNACTALVEHSPPLAGWLDVNDKLISGDAARKRAAHLVRDGRSVWRLRLTPAGVKLCSGLTLPAYLTPSNAPVSKPVTKVTAKPAKPVAPVTPAPVALLPAPAPAPADTPAQ